MVIIPWFGVLEQGCAWVFGSIVGSHYHAPPKYRWIIHEKIESGRHRTEDTNVSTESCFVSASRHGGDFTVSGATSGMLELARNQCFKYPEKSFIAVTFRWHLFGGLFIHTYLPLFVSSAETFVFTVTCNEWNVNKVIPDGLETQHVTG